jgi:hypothetical protein
MDSGTRTISGRDGGRPVDEFVSCIILPNICRATHWDFRMLNYLTAAVNSSMWIGNGGIINGGDSGTDDDKSYKGK